MDEIKKRSGRPKGSPNKPSIIKEKNKKLILQSLDENMGILAPALKVGGISRLTFNHYYNTDVDFKIQVDEIREKGMDYVESQLLKQIKDGGAAQTIFFLKTKCRDRGYIERTDTNMTIEAIKIKYIVPTDDEKKLDEPTTPLNNNEIKLNLHEKKV